METFPASLFREMRERCWQLCAPNWWVVAPIKHSNPKSKGQSGYDLSSVEIQFSIAVPAKHLREVSPPFLVKWGLERITIRFHPASD